MTAILTGSAEDDVVRSDGVPAAVCHASDSGFERWILERLDSSAVVAHQVMVMVASRMRRLEASEPVAEIDPLYEAESVETLDGAVDARDSDARPGRPELLVDLLRRETASLPAEEFHDGSPRASASAARRAETFERRLCPDRLRHGR